MASYFVRSAATGTGSGANWTDAFTTVTAALAAATADYDIIYVDSAHTGTSGASTSINWNVATSGNHVAIVSVNRNGSTTTGYSAWLAGAKETIATNAFNFNIITSGAQHLYVYGMTIEAPSGASNANDINLAGVSASLTSLTMDTCTLKIQGTSTGAQINIGPSGSSSMIRPIVVLKNCTFVLANAAVAGAIAPKCADITISNAIISFFGGTKPTVLFAVVAGGSLDMKVLASDLSGFDTTTSSLVNVAAFQAGQILFRDCRISSNASKTPNGTWPGNGASITYINVDSADTKTTFDYYNRLGTITVSELIYYSGGLTIKGTPVGWTIVTSSLCSEMEPFVTPWLMKASTSTSALTAKIEVCQATAAAKFTNKTLWYDLQYVSSASFPIGSIQIGEVITPFDTGAGSTAAVNWPDSSVTWNSISSPVRQYISGTVTPAEACDLMMRISVGVASKTLYMDPSIALS